MLKSEIRKAPSIERRPLHNAHDASALPAHNEQRKPTMTLDWLIIGGGIHGVHIAARLHASACTRAHMRTAHR